MESFSQFNEDVLVWQYFGQRKSGFFIEVGANAPFTFSQTWLLEKNGWKGILAEPLPWRCDELRRNRPGSRVFQVAVGAPDRRGTITLNIPEDDMFAALKPSKKGPVPVRSETVTLTTLDDILAESGNPGVDYVSIDVEGMEIDVLRGFDLARHKPALLLVEDHLKSRNVYCYLKERGYQLVKRTGCNHWFVPDGAKFGLSTFWERLYLLKKVNLNVPFNANRRRLVNFLKSLGGAEPS